MTIGQVAVIQISSQPYNSYISLADAETYMLGSFLAQTGTPTWSSQTTTLRAQSLVTASRILDRQRWKGVQVDPVTPQPLQWPRTNTGVDGVVDTLIPSKIVYACAEMGLALIQGSDLQTAQNQAQKIQSLRAGSVAISYFRLAEGPPIRWPMIINELLRDYLSSLITVASTSTGTGGVKPASEQDFGFSRGM